MELEEIEEQIILPVHQRADKTITVQDWETAQRLFVQGITYEDISAQTGIASTTLRNRASREKWLNLINAAREHELQQLALQWGANITKSIIKDSEVFSQMEYPDEPREMRDYEQARLTHIQSARLVLGIEKRDKAELNSGPDSLLVIGTGSDVSARRIKRVSRGRPSNKQDAAIDVDSSSSPTSTPAPGA